MAALNIIMMQQTQKDILKAVLIDIVKKLEGGDTLAVSFANYPKIFPKLFIHMVEVGELGGVLDEVLEQMAIHFEKEYELSEKIKSAMTYPVVVLSFSVLALIFLLVFVIPAIISVIMDMGMALPLPTRLVMAASILFQNYWYVILGGLASLILLFKYLKGTKKGWIIINKLVLQVPVLGQLTKKVILARFCRTFATLTKGGVPIIQALEVVKKATGNIVFGQAIEKVQDGVERGESLSQPLEQSQVFPIMITKMITVGEETGNLELLLEKAADFYEQEVNIMVSKLSSLLEPVLIIGLGSIVGFIILAVMLPVMGMSEGLM
ncbi:MAG: type II secretion system F family protein [Desulfotomaculum sp.]|nr:type II secretion system F family protein [Desulfotomaculum sp.]